MVDQRGRGGAAIRGLEARGRGESGDATAREPAEGRALAWTAFLDRRRTTRGAEAPLLSTAETVDCGCPEICHRDHEND